MRQIIIVLTVLISTIISAQENITYNLDECIAIAIENNLDLQSATLRRETANVNFRQSRNALLPNINGNYNIGKTTGRSIDPFTNTYINEELTFSNAGLQASATISNGFRLINRWKQQKYNLEASEMEREEARQNLVLEVTLAYLQVKNNQDLYNLALNRLESTNGQLERLQVLYEQEIGNPADYHDFQGLQANDRSTVINARNNLKDSKLNLMSLMNVDYEFDVEPVIIPIENSEASTNAKEIYSLALQNLATVKASEYRLDAAQKGVAVARSLYVPEFSLFANLSTNYSSAARIFNEGPSSIVDTGNFVDIDNQTYAVLTNRTQFIPEEISYNDQFENNLSTAYGIAVSIPIFNGFRAKNNVQLEKINREEATVELDRTKLQLRTAIEQAYNDLVAAYDRLEALQNQADAYQESFRINEVRFNNGVDNSVDYIISKNNIDNSLINLNNVKYEIVLREKVLEYYKGNL